MARSTQRPIHKLAAATSRCSAEAAAYGKCVVADYTTIDKDKCISEFMRLKTCYLKAITKK